MGWSSSTSTGASRSSARRRTAPRPPQRPSTFDRSSSSPGWSTRTRTCRSCRTPGVGFALDLLTWLDRLTFPTERSWSDPAVAAELAPRIFEAFAAAGTTTVLGYGVVYKDAMDAAFEAAEAHGIRAILGKVMMDRSTYDPTVDLASILDRSMQESADLISRWHGARRRSTGLRGDAAVRGQLHPGDPQRVRVARGIDRHLVADPRVGGPIRDRPGAAPVSRCDRLRRRL